MYLYLLFWLNKHRCGLERWGLVSEIAQLVRAFAVQPNDLSLITRAYRLTPENCPLTST